MHDMPAVLQFGWEKELARKKPGCFKNLWANSAACSHQRHTKLTMLPKKVCHRFCCVVEMNQSPRALKKL